VIWNKHRPVFHTYFFMFVFLVESKAMFISDFTESLKIPEAVSQAMFVSNLIAHNLNSPSELTLQKLHSESY